MDYDFPHLDRFISCRVWPLRMLRRWLLRIGVGYVVFNGNDEDLWIAGSKHIPYFSSALPIEEIDPLLGTLEEWAALRGMIHADDKIFPFAMNVDTMAMRLGYVVLRRGKPVGGVVMISS
jgi:hypothetical protein